MNERLYADAKEIIDRAIAAVLPDAAVRQALEGHDFPGRVILVAVGKAAWQMAHAAMETLGERIEKGIVITKYGHVRSELPGIVCREAGHPVPDENSFAATAEALSLVQGLSPDDTVLFLLSGGGSALLELPLLPGEELQDITAQLLACGADIVEINTIRKRLSAVKGGHFAQRCAPARVYSVILSDIIGDPVDMIASGPACADSSTCEEAQAVAEKYALRLSERARTLLHQETPKALPNAENIVTGSVRELCRAAENVCRELGYEPEILTTELQCEAKDAGRWLARLALERAGAGKPTALIAGGETVVHLTGNGMGGRNQELALAAAEIIADEDGILLFSLGSDGTDGPTDAAGAIVDGTTAGKLASAGYSIPTVLQDNDAYHALKAVDALIFTGPTGTNVNDVAVALFR